MEFIAPLLVQKGHQVFVYNSSLHPYQEKQWRGVDIIVKADPENKLGTFGQFIYDLNCIIDARGRHFDIILQLGYTSSSIWSFLMPRKPAIITNMDGLEWKRTKYKKPTQQFLKYAEKLAVRNSDYLIADSKGIQQYLRDKYKVDSSFIAYGAHVFAQPDAGVPEQHQLSPYGYNMLIARMEPENNIEPVLQGHRDSDRSGKLLVIGNYKNRYGMYLHQTYSSDRIVFLGPVYDIGLLNNLRYFSNLYFHGHSVGGTNPSLLEAMASHCLIVANDNIFNRSVLEEDAFYFNTAADITRLLNEGVEKTHYTSLLENNIQKIERQYSWEYIAGELLKLFEHATAGQ